MATNTPVLQLRKVDPDLVTGDNVDIDLDLNANWDKIDAEAGTVRTDISNLEIAFFASSGAIATLGSGAWTPVLFAAEDLDTANGHSTSSNTSRYTATVAGWYDLDGGHRFSASATGSRGARFSKNGAVIGSSDNIIPATPSGQMALSAKSITVQLGVGDYVELEAWQNTGGNLVVDAGSFRVKFARPV